MAKKPPPKMMKAKAKPMPKKTGKMPFVTKMEKSDAPV